MKNFFLMCLVALCSILVSCEKQDNIIINIERVPCEFHASQFVANVDDVMPMTKTDSPREIWYEFTATTGTNDAISGSCVEGEWMKVSLRKNTTYSAKFICNETDVNLLDNPAVLIDKENPRIFNAVEIIQVIDKPISEHVILKHLAGKYVAKVGHIPANHEVVLEVVSFTDRYNWLTDSPISIKPLIFEESLFSAKSGDLYSRFVVGGTDIKVKVGIRKENTNDIKKQETYIYTIPKASIRTVTYNINNIVGTDDFIITIDETLEETTEDQQIGKPQK